MQCHDGKNMQCMGVAKLHVCRLSAMHLLTQQVCKGFCSLFRQTSGVTLAGEEPMFSHKLRLPVTSPGFRSCGDGEGHGKRISVV